MKPFSPAFTTARHFGLVAAVHLPDSPEPVPEGVLNQLPDAEREHARTLRGYRQVSFVGGRLALHRAVRAMGRRPGPVLVSDGGMPDLPEGMAGSITHKRRLAVAVAARGSHGALGIDLEDLHPQRMGVAPRVLRPEEMAAVEALPEHRRWTGTVLRFSIKEAIYKALYPYVTRFVDFSEASVTPDTDCQAKVTLHLERGEGPFRVEARFEWLEGQVLSFVRINPAPVARAADPKQTAATAKPGRP